MNEWNRKKEGLVCETIYFNHDFEIRPCVCILMRKPFSSMSSFLIPNDIYRALQNLELSKLFYDIRSSISYIITCGYVRLGKSRTGYLYRQKKVHRIIHRIGSTTPTFTTNIQIYERSFVHN